MKRLGNNGVILVAATMLWSRNDGSDNNGTDNVGPSPDDPGVTGSGAIFAVPIP
jgi:hypothetical protein